MLKLKQRQLARSMKWQSDFDNYLSYHAVINELLNVSKKFFFILQPTDGLRLSTNFSKVLNNKVFDFIDESLKEFTIEITNDK